MSSPLFRLPSGDPLLQMPGNPYAQMAPVDPHAAMTAPIGPPTQMAAPGATGAPGQPASSMSPLDEQEGHLRTALMGKYKQDENPYGSPQNHPGFFGKLLHGLNVATGGVNRRQMEEGQLAKGIQDIEREKSAEGLQGAQTAEAQERIKEAPAKAASEEGLQGATKTNLESEARDRDLTAQQGPNLATAYAHAVNAAITAGRDPGSDPVVQHLADAITSIQKQTAPKGAHFIQREVGGKPHTIAVDDQTGQDIRDEGETGEKPPTVNVNAGTAALDRESTRFAKPYEKGVSDADAQIEKINDARNMVNGSAESQALAIPKVLTALVSGAGSGVRITQPELNAIARARGLSGDIEGTLNSWAGKGKLTTQQKQQLVQILDDVKARVLKKQAVHSEALDSINGAGMRDDIVKADKLARQRVNEISQYGFYTGEKTAHGTIVGFKDGKVQVDDAH